MTHSYETTVEKGSPSPANPKASELHKSIDVTLDPSEHPQTKSLTRKWVILGIICSSSLCAACASSVAAFAETGVEEEFNVSRIVSILSISLYVEGLGVGPLLFGPISEVYGRNIIYQVSYALFFAFTFAVAWAPHIAVHLVFRFVTGFCSSAFLSVAGGSVSDMFEDSKVGTPMAFFTISPLIGPVVGPFMSGFINQNLYWRWTYWILLIWIFLQTMALFLFVEETYVPVLTKRKAQRLRKETGNDAYCCPLDKRDKSLGQALKESCYVPFKLLIFDRMALLLDIWTALMLGILYLAFQAFPVIFEQVHGFSVQNTGMSFLGIGLGMLIALATQPYWNRVFAEEFRKHNGHPPPEVRLRIGEVGGIIVPLSLFWLAFTTYPHVHWIVPIVASVFFGIGTIQIFQSVFSYLVTAYRPISASAMAANSALRSIFAAVFPLFAGAMYQTLGTVGATALLAGLTALMAPLPFIFRRVGGRLRAKSKFAAQDAVKSIEVEDGQ